MRALAKQEILAISGSGREEVTAAGAIAGGIVGKVSKLPYGELIGSTIGGYFAGQGYDMFTNSPIITIPYVYVNPFTMGTPSYISTINNSWFNSH